MNIYPSHPSAVDDRMLDRLVDGELGKAERSRLLQSLDAEPEGWKRCATAFLEAQAWRGALIGAERAETPRGVCLSPRPLHVARLGGIAAAIGIAFLAGFFLRGGASTRESGAGPTVAVKAPAPPGPLIAQRPALSAKQAVAADAGRRAPVLPEYVRRQLERQGYEVREDRKLVPVALTDGRNVTVPVETVKYRYVGYRVY